jgi:hypothetical protein
MWPSVLNDLLACYCTGAEATTVVQIQIQDTVFIYLLVHARSPLFQGILLQLGAKRKILMYGGPDRPPFSTVLA